MNPRNVAFSFANAFRRSHVPQGEQSYVPQWEQSFKYILKECVPNLQNIIIEIGLTAWNTNNDVK